VPLPLYSVYTDASWDGDNHQVGLGAVVCTPNGVARCFAKVVSLKISINRELRALQVGVQRVFELLPVDDPAIVSIFSDNTGAVALFLQNLSSYVGARKRGTLHVIAGWKPRCSTGGMKLAHDLAFSVRLSKLPMEIEVRVPKGVDDIPNDVVDVVRCAMVSHYVGCSGTGKQAHAYFRSKCTEFPATIKARVDKEVICCSPTTAHDPQELTVDDPLALSRTAPSVHCMVGVSGGQYRSYSDVSQIIRDTLRAGQPPNAVYRAILEAGFRGVNWDWVCGCIKRYHVGSIKARVPPLDVQHYVFRMLSAGERPDFVIAAVLLLWPEVELSTVCYCFGQLPNWSICINGQFLEDALRVYKVLYATSLEQRHEVLAAFKDAGIDVALSRIRTWRKMGSLELQTWLYRQLAATRLRTLIPLAVDRVLSSMDEVDTTQVYHALWSKGIPVSYSRAVRECACSGLASPESGSCVSGDNSGAKLSEATLAIAMKQMQCGIKIVQIQRNLTAQGITCSYSALHRALYRVDSSGTEYDIEAIRRLITALVESGFANERIREIVAEAGFVINSRQFRTALRSVRAGTGG
jgi:hypothetical protein